MNLLSLDVSTSEQQQQEQQQAGFSADGFGDDDYRPGGSNMRRSGRK